MVVRVLRVRMAGTEPNLDRTTRFRRLGSRRTRVEVNGPWRGNSVAEDGIPGGGRGHRVDSAITI